MKSQTKTKIINLQNNVKNIRNICILAHVDHGKTTLADALIASNGIISKRMSGKLRYLDSRRDEQERGITMKSSSISIVHTHDNSDDYLINIIDSPGHVDFFGEVSTGIRLCDGAILVIDVIEGVCSQTKSSLQQAWFEGITPVLVLNKIDRLIIERQMTPLDAYIHLQQILEQINAFLGELLTTDILGKSTSNGGDGDATPKRTSISNSETDLTRKTYDWSSGLEEYDDSAVYFSPEYGNVVFCSAIDGWGFTIKSFSTFLSNKLGIRKEILHKTLWGDFYINMKEKRILKGAQSKAKKPLFVTLVLENIFSVYDTILVRRDKIGIEKIVNSLNVKFTNHDSNRCDARTQLQTVLSQWLPLSDAVLSMVCTIIPSPCDIKEERAERLMCSNTRSFDSLPQETQKLKTHLIECSPSVDAPIIICVSKMFSTEKRHLPQYRPQPLTVEEIIQKRIQIEENRNKNKTPIDVKSDDCDASKDNRFEEIVDFNTGDDNVFIAFARIFSGRVKKGDKLYVLGPKHDPSNITNTEIDPNLTLSDLSSHQHVTIAEIKDLYIMMGKELETLEEVSAGNIFGIRGLEKHILRSATISNSLYFPSFIDLHLSASVPILRVALEPQNPSEMPKLINGLKLLNQADPCVEVKLQESGEHIIITTGEVHLEKCIDDLIQSYAGIEINRSPPIVPFRESIIPQPKMDMANEKIVEKDAAVGESHNHIEMFTPNKNSMIKMKAKPLPSEVTKLLCENVDIIKVITKRQRQSSKGKLILENYSSQMLAAIEEFKKNLEIAFRDAEWNPECVNCIWSLGPKYCGPNILMNCASDYINLNIWNFNKSNDNINTNLQTDHRLEFDDSFVSGFQLASLAGPLCEEPLMGVCFILEEWTIINDVKSIQHDPYGPFSGQIMSTVKECCRKSFQAQPQRLMAAMYSCNIQVNSEVLGKMYALLGRRHGRVLHGDIREGSQTFAVTAVLPVIESFSFAYEIRKQTSGKATPQLLFSHWEIIDIDPFWVPSTEEEYLLYGEKADTENRARKYMNAIRRRKGLSVDEKIVQYAEKQRTLTKNK